MLRFFDDIWRRFSRRVLWNSSNVRSQVFFVWHFFIAQICANSGCSGAHAHFGAYLCQSALAARQSNPDQNPLVRTLEVELESRIFSCIWILGHARTHDKLPRPTM